MAATSLTTILKLGADVSQLITGLNQGISIIQKFGQAIKVIMDGVVRAAEKGLQALRNLARGIQQLTGQSARLDSMRDSFNKMAAEFGTTGQSLLAAMNEATLGMAKNSDLIQSSMTAMMLINKRAMGDVSETIPQFAKIATAAARALGEDVSFMFDSLVRGIGRASPMILDNLGFTFRLGEVYGNFAETLGKTAKQLTSVERSMALVNLVKEQGNDIVEKLGISTGGLATKQKQLAKIMDDLSDTIGQAFMPLTQAWQGIYSSIATTIIEKLIPAFRTLGRVMSEVFGTKNPFMRWIQGDQIEKTGERITSLVNNLLDLRKLGPAFADAEEALAEGIAKLQEKFGPRIEKIQVNLVERIQKIWDDFNFRRQRNDEDAQKEKERRTEDHYERLIELRNRFDLQIFDAIRNRDARALLNLTRQQKEAIDSENDTFEKSEEREEEDRAKGLQRDREDAQRRENEAVASASKQVAAVQAEFDKAHVKLLEQYEKQKEAAIAAWEAETKAIEDEITKQQELLVKQVQERKELLAELEEPLSPFFEKLKEILTWVWEKVQEIRDIILEIIEDPSSILSFIPDDIGERVTALKEGLVAVKEFVSEIGVRLQEFFGEDFSDMGGELKDLWGALAEAGRIFVEVLKILTPALRIALVAGLVVATVALKAFIFILSTTIGNIKNLVLTVSKFFAGWVKVVRGFGETIKGIFTGNIDLISTGLTRFLTGIGNIFFGFFGTFSTIISGNIRIYLSWIQGFIRAIINLVKDLVNQLIGNSIIPDMFKAISDFVSNWFTEQLASWREKWTGFVDLIREIWTLIIGVIGEKLNLAREMFAGWATNIKGLVTSIFQPIQQLGGMLQGVGGGGGGDSTINLNGWNIFGEGGALDATRDVVFNTVGDLMNAGTQGIQRFSDSWR